MNTCAICGRDLVGTDMVCPPCEESRRRDKVTATLQRLKLENPSDREDIEAALDAVGDYEGFWP